MNPFSWVRARRLGRALVGEGGGQSIRAARQGRPVGVEGLEERCLLAGMSVPKATWGDYDGDGKADVAVVRSDTSEWSIYGSRDGFRTFTYGIPGIDIPVPADYDGDGKADVAVYRTTTAQWFLLDSTTGRMRVGAFGAVGYDVPVPADYDGDGKADVAVYRPSTGQWFILNTRGGVTTLTYGYPGLDEPVPADYDGDGKADVAVYRTTTSEWLILPSMGGNLRVETGVPGAEIPAPADYDGDGKADVAVFRPSRSEWTIVGSGSGVTSSTTTRLFGGVLDLATPADYDGDGRADVAVFQTDTSRWWIDQTAGALRVLTFGVLGRDLPATRRTPLPGSASSWTWPYASFGIYQNAFLKRAKTEPAEVVFFGDSITFGWGDRGRSDRGSRVWDGQVEPLDASNFGVSGNRAENVLWQVRNGLLDGKPGVVVLMIGINDLSIGQAPREVAARIAAILAEIRARSPRTKILLLGILPVGPHPERSLKGRVAQTNALLAKLADGDAVRFLDAGPRFVAEDGTISKFVLSDYIHPSQEGYRLLSAAIQGPIQDMLGIASPTIRTTLAAPTEDLDGDGLADPILYRPSTGEWVIEESTGGTRIQRFGTPDRDQPVPADYDGDGRLDLAVYTGGGFSIRDSSTGTVRNVAFGLPGDLPVPADYDGDGKADVAVYRPTTGTWFILYSQFGYYAKAFGIPNVDRPSPADFDGDGRADIAVFGNGRFAYQGSRVVEFRSLPIGKAGDVPVPADYDGDGFADPAVFGGGRFLVRLSGTDEERTELLGTTGAVPVAADYDGDGRSDLAVFLAPVFTIKSSSTGSIRTVTLGDPGDLAPTAIRGTSTRSATAPAASLAPRRS